MISRKISTFSRIVAAALCLVLLFSVLLGTARSETASLITVRMDGRAIVTRTAPTIINGRVMVATDVIFNALKAEVSWSETAQTVTARRDRQVIVMTIGNATAQVNGQPKDMGIAPRFVNGNVMVPLRFVSETFGATVGWDAAASAVILTSTEASRRATTNVIFFHPDGFGLSHWDALRIFLSGPNGRINWNRLPHTAVYTGNMRDSLTGSSNGGATVHAYGIKVARDSFGLDGHAEITALSGERMSIMEEAIRAGFATAFVQTAELIEPGTAAFVASVKEHRMTVEEFRRIVEMGVFPAPPPRERHMEIAKQVIESGVDVILGGGERWLLPEGTPGRHGPGLRTDGLNLIERARALGYTVVYTRGELMNLHPATPRVLGVFAHGTTYNATTEEALRARGLPLYIAGAPTIAEMSEVALRILAQNPKSQARGFFMVAEEEGTDDFPNFANARGSFEAGKRADQAFGVFADFVEANPNTLLITTADSSAGGKQVGDWPIEVTGVIDVNTDADGRLARAPLDGVDGARTAPFMAAPNQAGVRLPFAVGWVSLHDLSSGVLVRAKGLNAEKVSAMGIVDNTDIYRLMYYTLFHRWLP